MRSLSLLFVLCVALFVPHGSAFAQTDVIRGRVTSVDGQALGGVRVSATSIPGNVTRTTRTDARGSFQLAFPGGTGDYLVNYALVGYASRQLQVKRFGDQEVLVADTRLQPMQLDTVLAVAPVQQRVQRGSRTPDVSGTERTIDATTQGVDVLGNLGALAASLPGVALIPGVEGAPDGFSVLGLGADANNLTLNGLDFGANGLPRDANVSASLTTSPFDPSRGGFAGGNLNLRTGSTSNLKTRGISLVTNAPPLQWTDPAGRALGTEFTSVSVGGRASGALVENKAFYNASFQVDRNARPNRTLLSTGSLGLITAGLSPDSVTRFFEALDARAIPRLIAADRTSLFNDNVSLFTSLDIQPPNAVNGDAYGITFNLNMGRQRPVGVGATQLAATSGDRINWGGGAQVRHNRYFGLWLSEASLAVNASRNYGDPYVDLPLGRVRVNSTLPNGTTGVQTLGFGGNQSLFNDVRTIGTQLQHTLSWFDDANKHRIKLSSEVRFSDTRQTIANNLRGTFAFNSLADFEAGRAASFTRQLTALERDLRQLNVALSLGDTWRRSADLQLQYGVRVETTRFPTSPTFNAAIDQTFDRRNDRLPTPIVVSPRLGFSYTLGSAQEIGAFAGAARVPRAVLRGGIGLFANGGAGGQVGSALDNTGLPSGVQQLVCTGDAAPLPDWTAYERDLGLIPSTCADGRGGSVFSNAAPNVVLFARSFQPQQAARANLSWQGPVLDARASLSVEGTFALNLHQAQPVDLNFESSPQFALASEANRPVFVQPSSIDPLTGAIAAADARVTSAFNRVTEYRSDLRSTTAQLSVRLSPIARGFQRFGWSAGYTYTYVREQVAGFQSTPGNPLAREWAVASIGPHQLSYNLRYNFFDYVTVNWNGQFRSGAGFTPIVANDLNGDGYTNDRAFIHDPRTEADATLRGELQQLYATLPNATRRCLERQLGRVAERNSCRAPWASTATLNLTLDRARFRMPQRASVNLSIDNPLGAADLLFNGADNLRGWGQNPFPDQALLYVRGFDAATQRFRYEVNQRFGQTRPQFLTLRSPVTMTVSMRIDLGPTLESQMLDQMLSQGRTRGTIRPPERELRTMIVQGVSNPMTSILRQQDSLRLDARQADSIAVLNRRYAYRADSIWLPVARRLSALPVNFNLDAAYADFLVARRAQVELLIRSVSEVTALLTPAQRRKLPPQVNNFLDPRFLRLIRNGNGLYVPATSGFSGASFGFESAGFFEVVSF